MMVKAEEIAAAFPYAELREGNARALHTWLARGGLIDTPLLPPVAETWTPLMLACAEGNPLLTRTIVQAGGARPSARVGTKVLASATPLHVAARYGHVSVASTLLELGAAVDGRDTIGMTPLHYGAGHGHLRVVQVLLDAGAQTVAEASGGATASDMADFGGFEDVVALLRRRDLRGKTGAASRQSLVAWLEAVGCEDYLARFLSAGYDDLAFMASQGLAEADLDCIGVPCEKLGLRRKLLAMHGVHDFLPDAEGESNHEGSGEEASSSRSSNESSDESDGSDTADNDDGTDESDGESSGSEGSGSEDAESDESSNS